MHSKPITIETPFSWVASKAVPIADNREPLVPVSYCPDRILARPQYFYQKLPHALPEIYLREGVYERLLRAAGHLPEGYRLVVYDGWRSLDLQEDLFIQYKNELGIQNPQLDDEELQELTKQFVAWPDSNPSSPSPHNTGGAVDLSVADECGRVLYMGAEFDETTNRSETMYFEKRLLDGVPLVGQEELALHNRRLLFNAMSLAGFTNYPGEWWHFDYGNQNWALISSQGQAVYKSIRLFSRWSARGADSGLSA